MIFASINIMIQQNAVVFHDAHLTSASTFPRSSSFAIFEALKGHIGFAHVFKLADAAVYLEKNSPELVILNLKEYRGQNVHPLAKLRKHFENLPIVLFCEKLSRDERIEIFRTQNVFAFDLSLEKQDIARYFQQFRFRNPKARSFVRFQRSRALSIEFESQKFAAHFIDYSQTGAQILSANFQAKAKSRILVTYESKATQQLRQIESYVVWSDGASRIGLQFLAFR